MLPPSIRAISKMLLSLVLLTMLSGCGLGLCLVSARCSQVGIAHLSMSLESFDFGSRAFGEATTAVLIITNSGTGPALELESVAPAAPFAFKGGSFPGEDGDCTSVLQSGGSCRLVVSYTSTPPEQLNTAVLSLNYFSGATLESVEIELTGTSNNGTYTGRLGIAGAIFAATPVSDGIHVFGNLSAVGDTPARAVKMTLDGGVESVFGPDHHNGSMVGALLNPDGKLYILGAFSTVNGTARSRVARIWPDGTVDTAFNPSTSFDWTPGDSSLAEDGDLYVVGDFSTYRGTASEGIVRINPNGTKDAGFNVGTGLNSEAYVVRPAMDGTGRVYVGGSFTQYNGTTARKVARLLSTGALDTTFNAGTGSNYYVFAIEPDPGAPGKVYVGGRFTSFAGTAREDLVRLNSNGTIDTSFNAGTGGEDVMAILPTADNKLYVAGNFPSFSTGTARGIVRLHDNGTVDTSFDPGIGVYNGTIENLAYVPDGSGDLFAWGTFSTYNGKPVSSVARIRPDGSLAEGWDQLGAGFDYVVGNVARVHGQPGALYVGGGFSIFRGTPVAQVVKLTATGKLDESFSPVTVNPYSTVSWVAPCLTTDCVYVNGPSAMTNQAAARLLPSGATDPSFNTPTLSTNISTLGEIPDGSGRIYISGNITTVSGSPAGRFVRLMSDGSVDSAHFSAVGTGFNSSVGYHRALEDGKVYASGGFATYKGSPSAGMARLNEDGSLDTSFAVGAGFTGGGGVGAATFDFDSSGNIYVGGAFTHYNGTAASKIIKLRPDGSVDTSFSYGSGFDSTVRSILVATVNGEDRIYVGGSFTTYKGASVYRFTRLKPDGSVDPDYPVSTLITVAPGGMILANDGSNDVIAYGGFESLLGVTCPFLCRISPAGVPD